MAVARAQTKGGVSGIHIWLIVFVALWLTSTVLLVLLYTDQTDLELTNEQLRASVDDGAAARRALESSLAAVAETVTGKPNDAPEVIASELTGLCARIAGDGLVPDALAFEQMSYLQALSTVYEAFKSENEKLAQALAHHDELRVQVEKSVSTNTAQKADFDEQIADLARQLNELKEKWEDYANARDREVDGFDQKLTELDARANKDIQDVRKENRRVLAKFDELQNRYRELKNILGELQITPQELITARQADGQVVTAKPGEEVVYIDLGRDAGLVLGLQFAVYSAAEGVPADGKGKARVEVVNIFDTAAECRIVEMHGRTPILEGDLVANPVFDRDRSLQFLVVGRFDIDGDGDIDPEGARQIESLVRSWGGTVTQALSARVDFVVLGGAPPKPFTVGDPTPEAQARAEAAQAVYDEYINTLETAKELSIPILVQSVFMHFLGYAT